MKGVQCYELFGGIALKIHTFSFFIFIVEKCELSFGNSVLVGDNNCITLLDLRRRCLTV